MSAHDSDSLSRLKRLGVYASIAGVAGVATLLAVRARAAGIPDADALTYTGYLENPDGTPVAGPLAIAVELWDDAAAGKKRCEQSNESVTPVSGRFQLTLPQECTDAVAAYPNLWADVKVDGTSLGRTKLGAVPYAVEAAHAASADTATNAAGLAVAPSFFSWAQFTVPSSNVESFTPEGEKTITFATAGYYRITLNSQGIHDGNTVSTIWWHLNGTAARLDNLIAESGGKSVQLLQTGAAESRQVASTVVFVKATSGQTLKINPSLTCVYGSGTFHQANFMYATEYIGPL